MECVIVNQGALPPKCFFLIGVLSYLFSYPAHYGSANSCIASGYTCYTQKSKDKRMFLRETLPGINEGESRCLVVYLALESMTKCMFGNKFQLFQKYVQLKRYTRVPSINLGSQPHQRIPQHSLNLSCRDLSFKTLPCLTDVHFVFLVLCTCAYNDSMTFFYCLMVCAVFL